MFSQGGHRSPYTNNLPLPHEPQPHFYGAPGAFELGLEQKYDMFPDLIPGADGYYCGFDTLDGAGHGPSKKAQDVLIVGYEGGLDVIKIGRRQSPVIGRLEGLRGSVIGARILPYTGRGDDLRKSRPLIALIIHGPVTHPKETIVRDDASSVVCEEENGKVSPAEGGEETDKDQEPGADVREYQTTVEVYSLSKQEHVATLFACAPTPLPTPITAPLFQRPPPSGDLRLDAKGKFVTVSSGESGEIFIFTSYLKKGKSASAEHFRCIGKLWTSIHVRRLGGGSSASSATEVNSHEADGAVCGFPIMSLSSRWIAYLPPSSSNRQSINGRALMSAGNPRPPGITHTLAPAPPAESCSIEGAYDEGLADRIFREGTQAALKGAKWATERGMQAFRSYWGGQQQNEADAMAGLDINAGQHFPPSHSQNPSLSPDRNESKIVVLYDLNKMLDAEDAKSKNVLAPMASFTPPNGVSFMSLSPSGLMLLTVSRKGDVQYVWNLMRSNDRKPRRPAKAITGPHVRQVIRISRSTAATVVDAAWSSPKNRRLALLTENGTVHMHPMPASAFSWPPPRDNRRITSSSLKHAESRDAANKERGGSAFNSARAAINGTAQTLSNAVRSRSNGNVVSNNPAKSSYLSSMGRTSAAGARTGRAAALGLSRYIGTAANNIVHHQDNKIHISTPGSAPLPNSICWLSSQARSRIAFVFEGQLDIYRTRMRPSRGKGKPASVTKTKGKPLQFGLPRIRGGLFAPAILAAINLNRDGKDQNAPLEGYWKFRSLPRTSIKNAQRKKKTNPLAFAEVETCDAYLPFHMDPRVAMYHFADPPVDEGGVQLPATDSDGGASGLLDGSASYLPPPKVGTLFHINESTRHRLHHPVPEETIHAVPVFKVHPNPSYGGHGNHDLDDLDDGGNLVIDTAVDYKKGEGGVGRQIVVTSTRRRRRVRATAGGQGGAIMVGEDEDDMDGDEDWNMVHYADD